MEEQTLAGLRRIAGVTAAYVVDGHGSVGMVEDSGGDRSAGQAQRALLGAVMAALRQAAGDLDIGELGETIIEAERGAVLAGQLRDGRAAVVVADRRANLGMIRVELRRLKRGP
jgi:predicted regulator of Ras-like GTPase activity (Roadblock/LC7/MglB family)